MKTLTIAALAFAGGYFAGIATLVMLFASSSWV